MKRFAFAAFLSLFAFSACQPSGSGGSKELNDRLENLEKKVDEKHAPKPVTKPIPPPAQKAKKNEGKGPTVLMKTNQGEIEILLFEDKAPLTVANFLKYVDDKFYDGTVFHRVIPTFMVQGGGFTMDSKTKGAQDLEEKKTRGPVKNESSNGLTNSRGSIAMARKPDPNSATAQFFFNVVDNARLDKYGGGYTVFGEVTKGLDIVDKIRAVPTGVCGRLPNCPKDAVIIQSLSRK